MPCRLWSQFRNAAGTARPASGTSGKPSVYLHQVDHDPSKAAGAPTGILGPGLRAAHVCRSRTAPTAFDPMFRRKGTNQNRQMARGTPWQLRKPSTGRPKVRAVAVTGSLPPESADPPGDGSFVWSRSRPVRFLYGPRSLFVLQMCLRRCVSFVLCLGAWISSSIRTFNISGSPHNADSRSDKRRPVCKHALFLCK